MKSLVRFIAAIVSFAALHASEPIEKNPAIDYPGFLEDAAAVERTRESRRVSEEEFLRMAAEPGTLILDARSADKFAMLHVVGAKNLPLPDFSAAALAQLIPDKSTPILIYCNNNFSGDELAMTRKSAPASLNIYTFTSLHSYGYTNIYELAPLRDLSASNLPFQGTHAAAIKSVTIGVRPCLLSFSRSPSIGISPHSQATSPQYRLTRDGDPICSFRASHSLLTVVRLRIGMHIGRPFAGLLPTEAEPQELEAVPLTVNHSRLGLVEA